MKEALMRSAITLAERAMSEGEVPVGCVIVREGEIIATGYNQREGDKNALAHAELVAINKACIAVGGWRLADCDLYVTLEPCPMCAGAIINSRIKKVVFGAYDKKSGVLGSVLDLFSYKFNHIAEVEGGFLADECGHLMSVFFKDLRR